MKDALTVYILLSGLHVCAGISILFLGVNLGVPAVRAAVFRTVTDIIQFVMYTITLALIIITGVIVAFGIEDFS